MAQDSAIAWTDKTWNPVHGCSIVSTECRNCYAAELSQRYRQTLKPWTPANAAENVMLKPHKLREPLSRGKAWQGVGAAAAAAGKSDGMLVFVNSMSDLFHERVPYEYIGEVFRVMERATRHTFQVLTKRPDRMAEAMADLYACGLGLGEPLPNVWLGVSVGLRQFARRLDVLRETPAAVRFVSCEPLLGPLVPPISDWYVRDLGYVAGPGSYHGTYFDGQREAYPVREAPEVFGPALDLTGIDWVIVGGESGKGHRPMDLAWASDIQEASREAGAAFFMKQRGGPRPDTLDGVPEELRIREFPRVGVTA